MNKTKHDLSAGIAKLNLNDLIKLANIASGLSKTECERELQRLQVSSLHQDINDCTYAAKNLARVAEYAAVVFENLHVLKEAQNRETILVNK